MRKNTYTVTRWYGDTAIDTWDIVAVNGYTAARMALQGQGYKMDAKRWCIERQADAWTLTSGNGAPEGSVTVTTKN